MDTRRHLLRSVLAASALYILSGCGDGTGQDARDASSSDENDVNTDADTDTDMDTDTDADTDTDSDSDTDADSDTDTDADGEADDMQFWFGNLHSHTAYSNGQGTPEEAFAWARDTAGFDFYVITDTADSLTEEEWRDTGSQADLFNEDGIFVAMRGFEWANNSVGHACVFDPSDYTTTKDTASLNAFYDWLIFQPTIAQFNHPGLFGDFDGLAFYQSAVEQMVTIESGNMNNGNSSGEYLDDYQAALDNGWMTAPSNNQDNHALSTNSHRTVYIAAELSRDALLDALVARRVYSSDDSNIEITYKVGDAWMGSRINVSGSTLSFFVHIIDDDAIASLAIISNNGATVASHLPAAGAHDVTWEPEVTADGDFYYLMVESQDGDIAVTAPFWID